MVGILFALLKLSHLQKQVCSYIVAAISKEASCLRDDWESASPRHGHVAIHSASRSHFSVSIESEDNESGSSALSFSAFGQLLSMLASPVIKRSSLLTDKLLRLLSLISLGQPDVLKRLDDSARQGENTEGGQAVNEDQIQLAVEVLTSMACIEEGLEDVTALLLNLSYGGTQTRESILHHLLAGARQLGNVVSAHVSDLLTELAELKASGGLAT